MKILSIILAISGTLLTSASYFKTSSAVKRDAINSSFMRLASDNDDKNLRDESVQNKILSTRLGQIGTVLICLSVVIQALE